MARTVTLAILLLVSAALGLGAPTHHFAQSEMAPQLGLNALGTGRNDPRAALQRTFRYYGGYVETVPINVALIFLGQWDPCAEQVLGDLIQSLGPRNGGPMPSRIRRGTPRTGVVSSGTVQGWWNTVRKYRRFTAPGVSLNATGQVYYYGSYHYPAARAINRELVVQITRDIKNPHKYFRSIYGDLPVLGRTIPVFLLGRGVPSPVGRRWSTSFCSLASYRSPRFPGFLGSVVVSAPGSVHWNPNCDWTPKMTASDIQVESANGCHQADTIASHVLAKLADLVTSPTQFLYRNPFQYGIPSAAVPPSYSCAQQVLGKFPSARLKGVFNPCTGANVCDLRSMALAQIGETPTSFRSLAPPAWPEGVALHPRNFFIDQITGTNFTTGRTVTRFANLFSEQYQFFVQPYFDMKRCTLGS